MSNTGKSGSFASNFGNDVAQAFTTGSNASGYRLTRVDFKISYAGGGATPSYTVKIHSNSSGRPGTSIGTLTNPATLPATSSGGLAQFTASGTGIALSPSTTYFVVIDNTTEAHGYRNSITTDDGEDTGGAAGWSIANSGLFRSYNSSGSWTTSDSSRQIAVYGYAATTGGPTISSIAISSTVPANQGGHYKIGDVIKVTATFNKVLTVTGSPQLKIKVGAAEKTATCAKKGTSTEDAKKLECSYTVAVGDADSDGIAVEVGKLSGGTITDGTTAAVLTYTAISDSSSHKVDGVRPTISGFSWPSASRIYSTNSTMTIKVDFSEAVNVTGTPTLAVTIGTQTRTFSYTAGGLRQRQQGFQVHHPGRRQRRGRYQRRRGQPHAALERVDQGRRGQRRRDPGGPPRPGRAEWAHGRHHRPRHRVPDRRAAARQRVDHHADGRVLFLGLLWRGFPALFGLNRDGFSRVRLF